MDAASPERPEKRLFTRREALKGTALIAATAAAGMSLKSDTISDMGLESAEWKAGKFDLLQKRFYAKAIKPAVGNLFSKTQEFIEKEKDNAKKEAMTANLDLNKG